MAVREALTQALTLAAGAKNLIAAGLHTPPAHADPRSGGRAVLLPALTAHDTRQDGWVNVATGLGTSRDKTGGTYYVAPGWLSDAELADLYNFNDLAAKCINLPIREAFKTGYKIGGIDQQDRLKEITNYLKPFGLLGKTKHAATWADLFGGSALWFRFADGSDPSTPLGARDLSALTPAESGSMPVRTLPRIDAIEVVDKRFLFPFRWYTDGPKAGRPMTYQLWVPRNGGVNSLMGEIHESRLVCFYSRAPTEALDKIRRQGWNQPVLQRVYEALQASGTVWKAIDILVADANQAVYSIKGLWRMITGDPTQGQDSQTGTGPSGGILNRIRFMDLMRSVSRAIVLDLDDETFERKPTNFASLPELSERQWVRVSAASDIPIPLLTGEYPSGLQSNGEGPFRVFYADVAGRREEDFGPKLLETIRLILSAEGAPAVTAGEMANLSIEWLPLWEPTAQELATIRLNRAQEGDILVQMQALTPEEYIMSVPAEWYPALDRERVQAAIDEQRNAPDDEQATATLALTPTDIAAVVTVNQALASVGLPDMPGPDGSLTVEAYRAKALAAGTAEGTPKPPPGAAPPAGAPGKPPFGKAGAAPARTDGKDHTTKQAAMGRWIVRHDSADFALAWGTSKVA